MALDSIELQKQALDIEREKLAIRKLEIVVEFAKFGFRGTLGAGVLGILLLALFAVLQAYRQFELSAWVYVGIAVVIVSGTVAFGYLSLRELPRVAIRIGKWVDTSVSGEQKSES